MKPSRVKTPARTNAASSRLARLQRLNSQDQENGAFAGGQTEEVAVLCRVRPLFSVNNSNNSSDTEKCVEVLDETTLQLLPPVTSRNFYNGRATQFSFKAVFDEDSTQKAVFQTCGLPLVKGLLQGRNGLLFTYGVTGSGKTHTMQGSPEDGGIMSRSIDVIFNSIQENMVPSKYLLVPDHLNDFQMQSSQEASMRQRTEHMNEIKASRSGYATRSNSSNPNLTGRMQDETKLDDFEHNRNYAVFISYCEIYNKYIYDLLEDTKDVVTGKPKFSSKILREDAHGNMYVHGATEVEVRSPKEALETFYRGQKRRRVAETQLNHESSRSHSVFNIRLVKCTPSQEHEGEIDFEKSCVVSQLALVDLAGSERTSRTGNTGDRLREAGNINNSLMNLRNCIERLRENQKNGRNNAVPYRNDKMTHLFRNYFEGIGSVKMIICVNPKSADYDETMNVLQFAEMAQEIEIERIDPIQRNFAAMTPARQKVQDAYLEAMNKNKTNVDVAKLNPEYSPIYSLGPAIPVISNSLIDDEEALSALERHIDQRLATRNTLVDDHKNQQELFRQRLVQKEKENILLREENQRLKVAFEGAERRNRDLESRLVNAEAANTSLQRRVGAYCDQKAVLENELDEKEIMLNKQKKESSQKERKLRTQLSQEKARKRSYEEEDFRGVNSRVAEMEAKLTVTTKTKKYRV